MDVGGSAGRAYIGVQTQWGDFLPGACPDRFALAEILTLILWTLQGGAFGKIARLNVSVRAVVLINLISTVSAKWGPNSVMIECRILTVPHRSPYFGEGGNPA